MQLLDCVLHLFCGLLDVVLDTVEDCALLDYEVAKVPEEVRQLRDRGGDLRDFVGALFDVDGYAGLCLGLELGAGLVSAGLHSSSFNVERFLLPPPSPAPEHSACTVLASGEQASVRDRANVLLRSSMRGARSQAG